MATEEPKAKKAKVGGEAAAPEVKLNDASEAYFELSGTRRATVRQFKGKTLVDIREVSRLHSPLEFILVRFITVIPLMILFVNLLSSTARMTR